MKKSLILFANLSLLVILLSIASSCSNYQRAVGVATAQSALMKRGLQVASTKVKAMWIKSGNTDYNVCQFMDDSDYVYVAEVVVQSQAGSRMSWNNFNTGNVFHAVTHEQYNPKFKKGLNPNNSYIGTNAICQDVTLIVEREKMVKEVVTLCRTKFSKWVFR